MERSENSEPQSLFSVVNDLSKVFGKRIKEDQMLSFLYPLLEGLMDAQTDSADGCCVVINGIFRQRGPELANEVPALLEALHQKVGLWFPWAGKTREALFFFFFGSSSSSFVRQMAAITQERTRTGILRAIRTLAAHHLKTVVKRLLEYDLPYDTHIVDTWHTLAVDETLAPRILDDLVEILNTG